MTMRDLRKRTADRLVCLVSEANVTSRDSSARLHDEKWNSRSNGETERKVKEKRGNWVSRMGRGVNASKGEEKRPTRSERQGWCANSKRAWNKAEKRGRPFTRSRPPQSSRRPPLPPRRHSWQPSLPASSSCQPRPGSRPVPTSKC